MNHIKKTFGIILCKCTNRHIDFKCILTFDCTQNSFTVILESAGTKLYAVFIVINSEERY